MSAKLIFYECNVPEQVLNRLVGKPVKVKDTANFCPIREGCEICPFYRLGNPGQGICEGIFDSRVAFKLVLNEGVWEMLEYRQKEWIRKK